MIKRMFGASLAIALGACSSLPDVEYRYFPTRSSTTISLTRTLQCDSIASEVVYYDSPSVTTTYGADRSKPYTIGIKTFERSFSPFVDSDLTFAFYDDGRLKSINQSTTGQGEAVIKAVASVITTLAPIIASRDIDAPKSQTPALRCIDVFLLGGGKPISVVYTAKANLADSVEQTLDLKVDPGSKSVAERLRGLPQMSVLVGRFESDGSGARFAKGTPTDADGVLLPLQEMGSVKLIIQEKEGKPVGETNVVVPGAKPYYLPVPRAALFGKQSFSLGLAESGAITSVSYGKLTGVPGALNAGTAIIGATQPPDAADAAKSKSKADVIAQQQRLARCQQKPVDCT